MSQTLFGLTLLTVIAVPAAKLAPVPKDAKPPVSCVVAFDPKLGPLEQNAVQVSLTNNTSEPIELYSTLPGGLLVFLDVEIEGPDGKRISPERYDATIASPYAPPARLVGTLTPNKPQKLELWLARYVVKPEELKPGKYRVRVKFFHGDRTATSGWVAWEFPKKGK